MIVNVTQWLDENYPVNGPCNNTNDKENCGSNPKTRNQIINLDVSNQNLNGTLDLTDFTSLLKLNACCNSLDGFLPAGNVNNLTTKIYESNIIQEVDFSYNVHIGNFGNWSADALKVFNFS